MTREQHREQARVFLRNAQELLENDDYVKLRGFKEIDIVLKMADLHERLSR